MHFWEYFDMLKMCLNFFCLFVCRDGLLYNFHRNSIIKWLDLYAEGVTYEGLEMLEMFTCFSYILDGKSEKNTHYKCKKKSVHDKLIKKIKLKKNILCPAIRELTMASRWVDFPKSDNVKFPSPN